jgi:hypothetical protein
MGLRWALQATTWVLLAGWFGSFSLFALVIAPTAFQVLPSQEAAGAFVGPVLASLHAYGIFAGLSLTALSVAQRQGWLAVALPLALAVTCAVSQYGVTPAINEVQPRSFGEHQQADAAVRFSQLHQTSRTLFGIVELGALGLILLHARPVKWQPREGSSHPSQARA